ncbi:MAG TPA: 50S ribosomal protein L4 [Candidatus Saccharimonadales bacterium]|nr:50S ribosomal protein L4 [Candidatus Saccharimonadales bacterium]
MKVATYSQAGAKQDSQATLDQAIFGLVPNHELLGLAYRAYLANGRAASATTLTRGQVRGGGKKPWRQKGTGRARVGSSRVPNWRGGGVIFGPSGQENYSVTLPAKMKRLAVRQALSAQADDGRVIVLEDFASPEGKVKPVVQLLGKIKADGKVILVLSQKDVLADRATRNIAGLKAVTASYLNVFDILNADKIIITAKALGRLGDWLGEGAASATKTAATANKAAPKTAKNSSTTSGQTKGRSAAAKTKRTAS